MFCSKCGAQMPEGTRFCASCGAPMEDASQQSSQQYYQQYSPQQYQPDPYQTQYAPSVPVKTGGGGGKILIAIVAIALIAAVAFVVFKLFGGKPYAKALDNFCEAMESADVDKFMELFDPEYLAYLEDESGMDEDEIKDGFEEYLDAALDAMEDEYGDDIKVTYEVIKEEKMEKDDLKDLNDDLEDKYDYGEEVTAAYELKVELEIEGSDDSDSDKQKLTVIEMDGDWYIAADGLV